MLEPRGPWIFAVSNAALGLSMAHDPLPPARPLGRGPCPPCQRAVMTHCRSENTSSSKARTAKAWGGIPLPSRLSQQLLLELGDRRKQVREALGTSLDLILSRDFPPRRDVLHWQFASRRWVLVAVVGEGAGKCVGVRRLLWHL